MSENSTEASSISNQDEQDHGARQSVSGRSSIGAARSGWYVGKYLGIRKHKAAGSYLFIK